MDKILSWQRPEFMEKDFRILVPGGDKDGCISESSMFVWTDAKN